MRTILKDKNVLSSINLNPIQGLKFVANGKLDGFVIDTQIGTYLSKELNLEHKLTATKYSLLQTKWHAAFYKEFYQTNQKKIDEFWKAFEKHRSHLVNGL